MADNGTERQWPIRRFTADLEELDGTPQEGSIYLAGYVVPNRHNPLKVDRFMKIHFSGGHLTASLFWDAYKEFPDGAVLKRGRSSVTVHREVDDDGDECVTLDVEVQMNDEFTYVTLYPAVCDEIAEHLEDYSAFLSGYHRTNKK